MNLPAGWETGTDSATGRTYYVNHHTQQTQWEAPAASAAATAPPPPGYQPPTSKNGYAERDVPQATATAVPVTHSVQTTHPQQQSQPQYYQQGVVTQQPAPAPQTVVVMQPGPGGSAPQGAPQGGQWVQEKYCGLITWLVGIFIFPCVCCCPCDDRVVYLVNGTRYNSFGAIVPAGCC
eukprot:g5579.t1